MHGFRSHIKGLLALAVVVGLFAPSAPAFAETADSNDGASPAAVGMESDHADTDEQLIQARIKELRELMASMDGLRANLTKMAEKALNDADMAPTLAERRRYEQLYTETNARIGELQTTRAEIVRLLGELETRLETLRHGR